MGSESRRILSVGLIGCGEVAQVVHIPTLTFLHDFFRITYLCDVSPSALRHCAAKLLHDSPTVKTTADPATLCAAPDVDLVLVLSADEYHAAHAILALQNGKHVFVEKPLALNRRDVSAIKEAEGKSVGRVMVGYMRRYAAPFEDAVREVGGMGAILYARIRDIIGPNATFVAQSGTCPKRFDDVVEVDKMDKEDRAKEMVTQALAEECGVSVTEEMATVWRLFCTLGSHDLSAMREALGMPARVVGASLGPPFWNVLFRYDSEPGKPGPGFTVSYESGVDEVPRFDAHVEVYSANKTVRVQFDTPFVKGLPVTMHVAEKGDGEAGVYKETMMRKTYEDPYTREMKKLWEMVVEGREVKTTVEDAMQDLEVFKMAVRYFVQSGELEGNVPSGAGEGKGKLGFNI